jgi:molybdopterin-guanine dinucleotide biosynthesis protein A
MYGLIIAGGQSRRFGTNKAFAELAGVPLLAHVATTLRLSVSTLAVAGSKEIADSIGAHFLPDPPDTARGPLSGVLAGLRWAESQGAGWLVTVPCDAPLVPSDFPERLVAGALRVNADLAIVRTRDGLQPLCAAWRPVLKDRLAAALAGGLHPAVHEFAASVDAANISFPEVDRFLNINTTDDLRRAEEILSRTP